jgi:hypothetical protein
MLILNSCERWRVARERFLTFVCKSMSSGVSLTILQPQYINIGSLKICDQFIETDIQ